MPSSDDPRDRPEHIDNLRASRAADDYVNAEKRLLEATSGLDD